MSCTDRSRHSAANEAWTDFHLGLIDGEDLETMLDDIFRPPGIPAERQALIAARLSAEKEAARVAQAAIEAQNARVRWFWPAEWAATCGLSNKHERQTKRRELRARLSAVPE